MACSSTSVERRCHGKSVGTLRTVQQCIECVRGDDDESALAKCIKRQGQGNIKSRSFFQTGKVGCKYNEVKVCGDKEQAHKLQSRHRGGKVEIDNQELNSLL